MKLKAKGIRLLKAGSLFCFQAFAFVNAAQRAHSKEAEAAAASAHKDVLPFHWDKGLIVQAMLTDNGREFCGKDNHPYELYAGPERE